MQNLLSWPKPRATTAIKVTVGKVTVAWLLQSGRGRVPIPREATGACDDHRNHRMRSGGSNSLQLTHSGKGRNP